MSFGGSTKGFLDTKEFRKCILDKANLRLGIIFSSPDDGARNIVNRESGLLALLDSSYKSDVPSTVYAIHLKSIAFESARFLCIAYKAADDLIFVSTRGEYLSQNIASFIFPNNRFPLTDFNDTYVRNFYLSIIEAYFGGSTKSNIENALFKFLNVPIEIIENFLLARNNATLDEIIKKFTFEVNIDPSDPRIKDINKVKKDSDFLLDIIKPAHTAYKTNFLFNDYFDDFTKGCTPVYDASGYPAVTQDGFDLRQKVANTAICDTFHTDIHNYGYEDFRKEDPHQYVVYVENELVQEIPAEGYKIFQANPRLVKTVGGGFWNYQEDEKIFHTRLGPFGKENGQLADDLNTDVKVYVNGLRVEIDELYPMSGAFKLKIQPAYTDRVTCSYYFLKDYVGPLLTNNFDSIINNFRRGAELSYKTVLTPTNYSPSDKIKAEFYHKYKGFSLFNSSVLNEAEHLQFNENGVRNKFNDANLFKSFGYDSNQYVTTLNEKTPLVPISLDKKDVWRRLPFQEIRLNNSEFIMNNREDRLFGEIHLESYHPFYSALEVSTSGNNGTLGLLSTIKEDATRGMTLEFQRIMSETIKLGPELANQLYTFPYTYAASGYTPINDPTFTLMGGNATWSFTAHPKDPSSDLYPSIIKSDIPDAGHTYSPTGEYLTTPHFGGNHGQGHILIDNILTDQTKPYDDGDISVSKTVFNVGDIFNLTSSEYRTEEAVIVRVIYPPSGNTTTASSLTFITSKKVLVYGQDYNEYTNDASIIKVSAIYNLTQSYSYDLTDIELFNQRILKVNLSSPVPYNANDIIEISYISCDTMNEYEDLVYLATPNYCFISNSAIDSMLELFSVTSSGKTNFNINSAVDNAYAGGVLVDNKIYLIPYAQAPQTLWHYIDLTDKFVYSYTHGVTAVANAYFGGVLDSRGRIYLLPYGQATQSEWHYIDTFTGEVVAYTHGASVVTNAYKGGVLSPTGKIYLIPYGQATQTQWHYIDTLTGEVVAYTHGASVVANAYCGGVLDVAHRKIYLVPNGQANQSQWHYIDIITGEVTAYVHHISAVSEAYCGGVLAGNGKIYLFPYKQTSQSHWHYIDTININTSVKLAQSTDIDTINDSFYSLAHPFSDGQTITLFSTDVLPGGLSAGIDYFIVNKTTDTFKISLTVDGSPVNILSVGNGILDITRNGQVVPYTTGISAVDYGYFGGVLEENGKIYLVPYKQGNKDLWHYIDTSSDQVVAYSPNLRNIVENAFCGGVLTSNNEIYYVPHAQADEAQCYFYTPTLGEFTSYRMGYQQIDSRLIRLDKNLNSSIAVNYGDLFFMRYIPVNTDEYAAPKLSSFGLFKTLYDIHPI